MSRLAGVSNEKATTEGGQTLWTNSRGGSTFEKLVTPSNLTELALKVAAEGQSNTEERVKAYQTPITTDTLRAPVK